MRKHIIGLGMVLGILMFLPGVKATASTVTVTDQNELEAALCDSGVTTIVVANQINLTYLDLDGEEISAKTITVEEPYVNADGSLNENASNYSMFSFGNSNYEIEFNNITFIGGAAPIFQMKGRATLYLKNCDLSRGICAVESQYENATLVAVNTKFHDFVTNNWYCGSISFSKGRVILDGCRIFNNKNKVSSGAAIYTCDALTYMNNCLVYNNNTSSSSGLYLNGESYVINSSFFGNVNKGNGCFTVSSKSIFVNCAFLYNYIKNSNTVGAAALWGKATLINCVTSLSFNSNPTLVNCKTADLDDYSIYTQYTSTGFQLANGTDAKYPAVGAEVKHGSVLATAGVYATSFEYQNLNNIMMSYHESFLLEKEMAIGKNGLDGAMEGYYIDGTERMPFVVGASKTDAKHTFTYTVENNELHATCTNVNCEFHSNPIIGQIEDTRTPYTGEEVMVSIEPLVDFITHTYTFTYVGIEGTDYNSENCPTEIGKYRIELTFPGLNGQKITGNLEIMNSLVVWSGGRNTKTEFYKSITIDYDYISDLGFFHDEDSTNKVFCIVTDADVTDIESVFNVEKGALISSVKSKLATAKYNKKTCELVVTAGKATRDSTVRVWIIEYQKKNTREELDAEVLAYADFLIDVKVAPTKIEARENGQKASKLFVDIGSSATVSIVPITKTETVSQDCTYTVEVTKAEHKELVNIVENEDGTFTITALKTLKGKATKVTVVCTNVESGKRFNIALTIENSIESISPYVNLVNDGKLEVTKNTADNKACTIEMAMTAVNSDESTTVTTTTNKINVYVVSTVEANAGYTLTNGTKLSITAKSKDVSASYKAKTGTLTLRLSKNVTTETVSKLLIVVTGASGKRSVYEYPIVIK